MVRGAAVLPHSWQKGLRIAVFAEGEAADEARAAGGYSVQQAVPACADFVLWVACGWRRQQMSSLIWPLHETCCLQARMR